MGAPRGPRRPAGRQGLRPRRSWSAEVAGSRGPPLGVQPPHAAAPPALVHGPLRSARGSGRAASADPGRSEAGLPLAGARRRAGPRAEEAPRHWVAQRGLLGRKRVPSMVRKVSPRSVVLGASLPPQGSHAGCLPSQSRVSSSFVLKEHVFVRNKKAKDAHPRWGGQGQAHCSPPSAPE